MSELGYEGIPDYAVKIIKKVHRDTAHIDTVPPYRVAILTMEDADIMLQKKVYERNKVCMVDSFGNLRFEASALADTMVVENIGMAYPSASRFNYQFDYSFANAHIICLDKSDKVLRYDIAANGPTIALPVGTDKILFPYIKETQWNAFLHVDFYAHDVTMDIVDWNDIVYNIHRSNLTPVHNESGAPTRYCRGARRFIMDLVRSNGLYPDVYLEMYQRSNGLNPETKRCYYWLGKRSRLDFTTYKLTDNFVDISDQDADVKADINSYSSVEYDIPVHLMNPETWKYKRMKLLNTGSWSIAEEIQGRSFSLPPGAQQDRYISPFANYDKAEMIPGSAEHDMKTQKAGIGFSPTDYFFEAADDETVSLNINFRFKFHQTEGDIRDGRKFLSQKVCIVKKLAGSNTYEQVYTFPFEQSKDTVIVFNYQGSLKLSAIKDGDGNLIEGDKLSLCVVVTAKTDNSAGYAFHTRLNISDAGVFNISYWDSPDEELSVDVIDPEVLVQNLIDRMAPGKGYKCAIHWKAADYKTFIVAGESLRGFKNAFVHTNFEDFWAWMKFLGYEMQDNGKFLEWRPRDYYFDKSTIAIDLKEKEVKDFTIEADLDYAYSCLKIGYEQQNYDNINGRYEVMGTYNYMTSYQSDSKNTSDHEIISPYRADPMGMEFLIWSRDNKTKDKSDDSDLFFVALKKDGDVYKVYDDELIEAELEDFKGERVELFNAPFHPYYIIRANESRIGINTRQLTFQGTEANRLAKSTVDPELFASEIVLSEQLFRPFRAQFSVGLRQALPIGDARNGIVRLRYMGETYEGFIWRVGRTVYANKEQNQWQIDLI